MTQEASTKDLQDETRLESDTTTLSSLVKMGLITQVKSANCSPDQYALTPKGTQFIVDYKKLQQQSDKLSLFSE